MPGAVKARAKRSGKRNKWGDPRGETVYAGFPESLDSGVPRSGMETSPEGRARGEGWIWPRPQFTEEQRGTSIDENAPLQVFPRPR
jgi:hypothetical protein